MESTTTEVEHHRTKSSSRRSATQTLQSPSDGILEGNYHFPHLWPAGAVLITSEGEPVGDGMMRVMTLLPGDEQAGPLLFFASIAPGVVIPAEIVKQGAHYHRTDTFRMPVLHETHAQLKDGAAWLSTGDFLLMGANKVYVESVSPHGATLFGVYADRRGYAPGFHERSPYNKQLDEWPEAVRPMFAPVEGAHVRDEDAGDVLAATFAEAARRPASIAGSFHDDTSWTRLSDGSTVAAAFLGDPVAGCITMVANNGPGAVEAPAARPNTDTVRLVVSGSVGIGDRTYGPGEFRITDAGVLEGPIVHGPHGSSTVTVYADRRDWLATPDAGGDIVDQCPRLGEVAAMVDTYIRRLAPTS